MPRVRPAGPRGAWLAHRAPADDVALDAAEITPMGPVSWPPATEELDVHGDLWVARLARQFRRLVQATGHGRGPRWYTEAECERVMRQLSNGERGCQAPREHLR